MCPGQRYLEKTFVHAACTLRKEIITSVWWKHYAGSLFYFLHLPIASWFLASANAVPWNSTTVYYWKSACGIFKSRARPSLFLFLLCGSCQLLYTWALIFKLLRSPRIDSKEPIPPGCVAWRAGYDNPIPIRFLALTRLFKNSSTEAELKHCIICL